MAKLCILTGAECPVFKKMCLNCEFSSTEDGETYVCNNEENKAAVIEKIKASIPETYGLVNLELAPRPLKAPTRKCGHWTLDKKAVWSAVQEIFDGPENEPQKVDNN